MKPTPEPGGLVGRSDELGAVGQLLADPRRRALGLLIAGEPGIGKTSLWSAAAWAARTASYRVLKSRPSRAEAKLSFAALGDLLGDALDFVLSRIPKPQREALEIALLLRAPNGGAAGPRVVGLAVLSSLVALVGESPVAIAIDDLQWMDMPSAAALTFALRRLADERVRVIASVRLGESGRAPLDLERVLGEGDTQTLILTPLTVGALHHIIHTRLGTSLPRPVLHRLTRESGGNPFYALELARALDRAGATDTITGNARISTPLHDLVRDRVRGLPPRTREVLTAVALAADPSAGLIARVVDDAERHLEPAVEADVIEFDGERIRFTHPLLAAAVEADRPPLARRELHRRLSEVVKDPEQSARHLALATSEPDREAVLVLESAVAIAHARGAPGAVAELTEHVLRLTPPDEDEALRISRTLTAATARFEEGDPRRACELLEPVAQLAAPGAARAEALLLLARIRGEIETVDVAAELCRKALAQAPRGSALHAEIEGELAWLSFFAGEPRLAACRARAAVDLAARLGDATAHAHALAAQAMAEFVTGDAQHATTLEAALVAESNADRVRLDRSPEYVAGFVDLWSGRLDSAHGRFDRIRATAIERGDESNESAALFSLCLLECLAGDWDAARGHADEGLAMAEQSGVNLREMTFASAHLDAHLGAIDAARSRTTAALTAAEADGEPLAQLRYLSTLGFLELSCGDGPTAAVRLAAAANVAAAIGWQQPGLLRFVPDQVEALISRGDFDAAEQALDPFAERVAGTTHPWATGAVDRCRGLLAAARGDLAGAVQTLERAARAHRDSGQPFEEARTLLALGIVQRRAMRRREARGSLEVALATFDRLGAQTWLERAKTELSRIGGRTTSRDRELTSMEQGIADLVAAGRTNREVAADVFVSVKTVEANLTRIYAKLGVRSRSELAARVRRS